MKLVYTVHCFNRIYSPWLNLLFSLLAYSELHALTVQPLLSFRGNTNADQLKQNVDLPKK